MISNRTWVTTSLFVSSAMAIVAFLTKDWMWLIVDLLSIFLLVLPSAKNLGYYYSRSILVATMISPSLVIAVYLINVFVYPINSHILLDVSYMDYIYAALQTLQCFVSGFMLAQIMDRTFGMTLSKRWMVLFAMMVSLAVSVLDLFFMFINLYTNGYPVFNGDFQHGSERISNRLLIVSPFVATFVSAAYALIAVRLLRNHDKSDFIMNLEVRE